MRFIACLLFWRLKVFNYLELAFNKRPLCLFGFIEKWSNLGRRQCATVQVRCWLCTLVSTYRREAVRGGHTVNTTGGRTGGWGETESRKGNWRNRNKETQQKVEQMSARRPCCVGFICVLVYLVGGVAAAAAAAAATAVGHRPLLWQRLCRFPRRRPDAVAVLRFCWSVKRRASERVRGCGFGSGPRTGKASMCQGYCEISR